MSANRITGNFDTLNSFIKGMSEKWIVKVGIMGTKASRKGDAGTNNAEIGAVHEFGSPAQHIPQRSFLRMPIQTRQDKIVDEVASKTAPWMLHHDTPTAARTVQKVMLTFLGIACENVVQQAFDTKGFGEWAPNTPARATYKLTSRGKKATPENVAKDHPLIDTGQLRRSIASKVEAA